jgi:cysteine-rich repeat protein
MRYLFLLLFFPLSIWAQSAPTCGNGVHEVGERCDDGNASNGDGCSSSCVPEFCGDKIVNKQGEQCDDGNSRSNDGCFDCMIIAERPTQQEDDEEPESSTPLISPEEAFRRSLVTTLFLPSGLGLLYGPSMGHFAAGERGRGVGMTLLRTGLVGIAVGISRSQLFIVNDPDFNPQLGTRLIALDGLLLMTLVGVDLLDSAKAIERARKK